MFSVAAGLAGLGACRSSVSTPRRVPTSQATGQNFPDAHCCAQDLDPSRAGFARPRHIVPARQPAGRPVATHAANDRGRSWHPAVALAQLAGKARKGAGDVTSWPCCLGDVFSDVNARAFHECTGAGKVGPAQPAGLSTPGCPLGGLPQGRTKVERCVPGRARSKNPEIGRKDREEGRRNGIARRIDSTNYPAIQRNGGVR